MILMIVDNRGQSRFFVLNRGFDRILEPEPDLNPPEPDRTKSNSSFLILFRHYSVSRFHPDEEN